MGLASFIFIQNDTFYFMLLEETSNKCSKNTENLIVGN